METKQTQKKKGSAFLVPDAALLFLFFDLPIKKKEINLSGEKSLLLKDRGEKVHHLLENPTKNKRCRRKGAGEITEFISAIQSNCRRVLSEAANHSA